MRTFCLTIIAVLMALAASSPIIADEVSIDIVDGTFHDAKRDRDVPYRAYHPADNAGPAPVVIFSHELGGSREGAAYFGRHLAAYGFVALHIQHPGSDDEIIKEAGPNQADISSALTKAIKKPRNALNRFRDVTFVIDAITEMNSSNGEMTGWFDLDRIGLAGHSFGARATMIAAGERVGPGLSFSFKEPRLKAALVMSPNTPDKKVNYAKAYRDIDIPMLHITGTEDRGALPEHRMTEPEMRTVPYANITNSDQYLLVLDKADHSTFSGRRLGTADETPDDGRHTNVVKSIAAKFFDATLKGDEDAMIWLKSDFQAELTPGDRFEFRLTGAQPQKETRTN